MEGYCYNSHMQNEKMTCAELKEGRHQLIVAVIIRNEQENF